jgi:hypothetical protein
MKIVLQTVVALLALSSVEAGKKKKNKNRNRTTEAPTSAPTSAPTKAPEIEQAVGKKPLLANDPHLRSWGGEWFDYMGECDLVLLNAPLFDWKQDMTVHVRTKIRYDYSYIEAAALKIGEDVLEVRSYGDYAWNGIDQAEDNGAVPSLGEYPVYHKKVSEVKHVFDVVINEHENITISTFKDWVSVGVMDGDEDRFGSVTGLMGSYDGSMLGRDGTNLHDDINALGQDWQVRPEEGQLFRTVRAPQYPEACNLPVATVESRRLGEGISREAAEEACAQLEGKSRSLCVSDVIASGDLDVANSGTY